MTFSITNWGLFRSKLKMKCMAVGMVLVTLESIKLLLNSDDIYEIYRFAQLRNVDNISKEFKLVLIISFIFQVTHILELLFILILLIGLVKNHKDYLKTFPRPTVIVYLIENLAQIFACSYFGIRLNSFYLKLLFSLTLTIKHIVSNELIITNNLILLLMINPDKISYEKEKSLSINYALLLFFSVLIPCFLIMIWTHMKTNSQTLL